MNVASLIPPASLLFTSIGYEFHDETLLLTALAHPSFDSKSNLNNQRLEFLGDAILNSIITEKLYRDFPCEREGTLTRFRSLLVREETLALIARELGLNNFLLLGPGEKKQNPNGSDAILADALEALIAAIYMDIKSFADCATIVTTWFEKQINNLSLKKHQAKDAKTFLQEHLQKQQKPLPIYETTFNKKAKKEHQHKALCYIEGLDSVEGYGSSRRKAEQAAAKLAIEKMNL